MAIVVPGTKRDRRTRSHVRVSTPEASLSLPTFFMSEQVRSISLERFDTRIGKVSEETLRAVEVRLRLILGMEDALDG